MDYKNISESTRQKVEEVMLDATEILSTVPEKKRSIYKCRIRSNFNLERTDRILLTKLRQAINIMSQKCYIEERERRELKEYEKSIIDELFRRTRERLQKNCYTEDDYKRHYKNFKEFIKSTEPKYCQSDLVCELGNMCRADLEKVGD